MPTDDYPTSKQFFEKKTEDGETHVKMSFTTFKYENTSEIDSGIFQHNKLSSPNHALSHNMWRPSNIYAFYIEKMRYEMTYYERLVYMKIILRELHHLGFPLNRYLKEGYLMSEKEIIDIGFRILNDDKEFHRYITDDTFYICFKNRSMYYMDIRITNEFWSKYLKLPKTHEINMDFVYRKNEHELRNSPKKYTRNSLFEVDRKAYELDMMNDDRLFYEYRVPLLLDNTIYKFCEYY